MDAYEHILKAINRGVNSFVVAMLAVYFFLMHNGTLSKNNMNEANLNLIMGRIGYNFDTSTSMLTNGTDSYTVYQMIDKVFTDFYSGSEYINSSTMIVIVSVCFKKGKITEAEKNTLLGKV